MNKIIHQTWQTAEIPEKDFPHAWQESWRRWNPDWEYRFWTDEDNERLVRDHYPMFLDGFMALGKGVIKADVARALYMHRFGGIYADLDYICLKPFGTMLELMSKWIPHGISSRLLLSDQSLHETDWSMTMGNDLMYAESPGNDGILRYVSDGLNAYMTDENYRTDQAVEAVCGARRIGWLKREGADYGTFLAWPCDLVCPNGELHSFHDIQAWNNWSDLDRVSKEFPDSYSVTMRRRCWADGPWSAGGVLGKIKGS